jgi:Acyltransferase family
MTAYSRSFYLDRLRVVLTALVILHHTAITYGGSGGWFYREVPSSSNPTSLLLTLFCAVNQSFFMGMFFLLAGYFTPGSLHRKGLAPFIQERLIRLGLPLLFFGFVLGPLTVALAAWPKSQDVLQRWLSQLAQGSFVIGPLWFVFALLIFSLAYVAWRQCMAERASEPQRDVPASRAWVCAALAVGAAALGIRLIIPVGEQVWGLQLGYFASYVFLFALGCVASRDRWLDRLEHMQARRWLWLSLVCIPMLFIAAALAGALAGKPVNFNGGLSIPAVVYAFWEPFVAWGLIAWLLVSFRAKFNSPSPRWERWATQAYGAFILHAPVLVGISVLLSGWAAPAALKFAVVGIASIAATFELTRIILKLPLARRVI